jgi:hypothetical protein
VSGTPDTPLLRRAAWLGIIGSALGIVAGLVEASVGADIREWIGDKSSPFPLGIVTIVLSLVALGAALVARRQPTTAAGRLAVGLGLLLPGGVGFTTVGRLWYVPGLLLVVAGALALAAAHRTGNLGSVVARSWGRILLGVLGAIYAFLGVLAFDVATVLAFVGVAGVVMTLAGIPASPRWRAVVLVVSVLPFAVVTWWSVVAPLSAALIVAVGIPQVAGRRSARPVAAGGA